MMKAKCRVSMIAILLLASAALGQATKTATTKPAKPFNSYAAMYSGCPKDLLPKKGDKWQALTGTLVNEWFAKNIQGKEFKGELQLDGANKDVNGDLVASLRIPDFTFVGIKLQGGTAQAMCRPKQDTIFAKLKKGDRVRIRATIGDTTISGVSVAEGTGQVLSKLSDCEITK